MIRTVLVDERVPFVAAPEVAHSDAKLRGEDLQRTIIDSVERDLGHDFGTGSNDGLAARFHLGKFRSMAYTRDARSSGKGSCNDSFERELEVLQLGIFGLGS